jgi:hypothetical protein
MQFHSSFWICWINQGGVTLVDILLNLTSNFIPDQYVHQLLIHKHIFKGLLIPKFGCSMGQEFSIICFIMKIWEILVILTILKKVKSIRVI